jgi:hypothetical protein
MLSHTIQNLNIGNNMGAHKASNEKGKDSHPSLVPPSGHMDKDKKMAR